MLTSDTVWNGLMGDPQLTVLPKPVQDVIRAYVNRLPELVADLLDKPVTPQNIIDAKLRFLRHCRDNDFIARYTDAIPDEALGLLSRDKYKVMFSDLLVNLVKLLESLASNSASLLSVPGITEEALSPNLVGGLYGEALKLHLDGNLTIEKLLEHQPAIIVRTNM